MAPRWQMAILGMLCDRLCVRDCHPPCAGVGLAIGTWRGAIGVVSNSWAAAPSRLPEWRSYHHLSDTESKPLSLMPHRRPPSKPHYEQAVGRTLVYLQTSVQIRYVTRSRLPLPIARGGQSTKTIGGLLKKIIAFASACVASCLSGPALPQCKAYLYP
jgi:hypothetical protein